MDIQRTMEFILDQQAAMAAKQMEMTAWQEKTDKRLTALQEKTDKRLNGIGKLIQHGMKMLTKTGEQIKELSAGHKELAAAQKQTDAQLKQLAAAQERTEQNLNRFIESLRQGPNGRKR